MASIVCLYGSRALAFVSCGYHLVKWKSDNVNGVGSVTTPSLSHLATGTTELCVKTTYAIPLGILMQVDEYGYCPTELLYFCLMDEN